jgi:hypothetical protein
MKNEKTEVTVREFYDVKLAMKFINNIEQEIIIRNNMIYDKQNNLIAIIHLSTNAKK